MYFCLPHPFADWLQFKCCTQLDKCVKPALNVEQLNPRCVWFVRLGKFKMSSSSNYFAENQLVWCACTPDRSLWFSTQQLHTVYITITLLSFQQLICLGIVGAWGLKEFHEVLIPQLKCVCLLLSHLVSSRYDWHNQTCLIGASHLINQSDCIITCGSLE